MISQKHRAGTLRSATAVAALAAYVWGVPASAQSIEELKEQLALLAKRIEELEKKQEKTVVVKKEEPASELGFAAGDFTFNVRGRIFADAAWASDKDNAMDLSATELRAARLGIEGKAGARTGYKFEVDFAGDEVELKDAFLSYKAGHGVTYQLGQFNPPTSMEELTSSRHTTFMERSSYTDAFGFARQIGVSATIGGDNYSVSAGAFRGSAGTSGEKEGETLAIRGHYGDKIGDGAWMLGASVRYRNLDEGAFRYRQRPHQHLSTLRFIDTGNVTSKDVLYGLEAAYVQGPFHATGEWAFVSADNVAADGGNASFNGGFVEIGMFLTDEQRALKLGQGVWDRPKVNNPVDEGGFGAWQIAARFDRIDLSDKGVFGGEMDTYLLGVNWYLNRYARMMLNLSRSDIENAFGVAANGTDGENSVDALGLRFQVDW